MSIIYHSLKEARYLTEAPEAYEKGYQALGFCKHHQAIVGHNLEDCPQFKEKVQTMMILGVIGLEKTDSEVCTAGKRCVEFTINKPTMARRQTVNKPAPILFDVEPVQGHPTQQLVLTINQPAPFPYESNRAVPWIYGRQEKSDDEEEEVVTSIVGPGGMTQSGRVYQRRDPRMANKGKEVATEEPKESEDSKKTTADEEFLAIMKQSDYSVVEQLKRTPAKISILSLILSSKAHRQALQKVLEEAFVPQDITPEKAANVMNVARVASNISFSEEELARAMIDRPKALHITLRCKGYVVAKVLIDGGSALNVLPLITLRQLPIETSNLVKSEVIVRAFDGSKREVIGSICLPLEIGPKEFCVEFHVMDITPSYTMLLGRPWIHGAGAVPSTLHQRVKFIDEGKIISVKGEEEIMVSRPSSLPYVEAAEQEIETAFQSLEVDGSQQKEEKVGSIGAKIMRRSGFEIGQGLGARSQGIKTPLILPDNRQRYGLGYDPTIEACFQEQASLKDRPKPKLLPVPYIHDTYPTSSTVINLPDVSMIEDHDEGTSVDDTNDVHVELGEALDNWEFQSIPEIFTLE